MDVGNFEGGPENWPRKEKDVRLPAFSPLLHSPHLLHPRCRPARPLKLLQPANRFIAGSILSGFAFPYIR